MLIVFGCEAQVKVRSVLLVALGLLLTAGPPLPAQSTGGAPVSFGPNVRISGAPSDPPGTVHLETSIGANPLNARNLVAGYMDFPPNIGDTRPCSFSFTTDGGLSWTVGGDVPLRHLPGQSACDDPAVAADNRGIFYYAYLDDNFPPGGGENLDIRVAVSTDGGMSFPTSTAAAHQGPTDFLDKPYLAVDSQAGSPFKGTLYVSYTNFGSPTGIFVVVSRDGGSTWSVPVLLDGPSMTQNILQSSVPVVAADGTAYVFWAKYAAYTPPTSIRFSRSTDGGQSWSPPADVASKLPSPGSFYLKNADPQFGSTVNRGIPVESFPTAAVASDGTVFVAWTDFPNGKCDRSTKLGPIKPCTNADIRLSVSRDRGATWSAPVKVNDDSGTSDQFFPWMAAHPNGLVSLSWIDRRLDPNNVNYDVFYTNTFDGANFLPDVRVTTATSILGLAFGIGDYNGMAATGDCVFPAWGDLRQPAEQIFSARGVLAP